MAGYTIKTLAEVPDILGDYPGEMHLLTRDLGAEQVALTYRRMPKHTGGKGSYGHFHKEAEEIYFVVSGTLLFKLGDDLSRPEQGTAIRVAPEVVRSVWNDEDEDAELVIVSKWLEDPLGDTELAPRVLAGLVGPRAGPAAGTATGDRPAAAERHELCLRRQLGELWCPRSHRCHPSLQVEYLDVERLPTGYLDVKRFCVKISS